MARLLWKAVGLIAAYAIALQALFSGVPATAYGNPDPLSIICTGDMSDDSGSLPQHEGHDCRACILTCGGAIPSLTPSSVTVLAVLFLERVRQPELWFEALPSQLRHQPR